jgi:hypothetical protein
MKLSHSADPASPAKWREPAGKRAAYRDEAAHLHQGTCSGTLKFERSALKSAKFQDSARPAQQELRAPKREWGRSKSFEASPAGPTNHGGGEPVRRKPSDVRAASGAGIAMPRVRLARQRACA